MNDGVKKHRRADRLEQKTFKADLIRLLHDFFATVGGHHDNMGNMRQLGIFLDALGCLNTVHARHLPVHDDHLKRFVFVRLFDLGDTFLPGCRQGDLK